jgi:hypothetical protein
LKYAKCHQHDLRRQRVAQAFVRPIACGYGPQ